VFDHSLHAVISCPSITLVNGRYKLWNYVNSDTELMDIGPAVTNAWHTAYLYARNDGWLNYGGMTICF